MMNNKEKYKDFCKKEKNITIFSQYWWLDAVCGKEGWDVVLAEKGGNIYASMPYMLYKKHGLTFSTMPMLTQTLGPYIKYPEGQKYVKKLSYEKEIMNILIEKLPPVDYFYQQFNYSIINWLPFYWREYQQTTRYTYILSNVDDINTIFENFQSNIKTDIKKARKLLTIYENENLETIYKLVNKTFERQNLVMPYNLEFLEQIDLKVKKHANVLSLSARDSDENIHAVAYIVYDLNEAYYLIGGADPKFRNSGAQSLLIYSAMELLFHNSKVFNFEGSMIESIEKFFRGFGTVPKPYFAISKSSRKMRIINASKEIVKAIIRR